MKIALYKRHDYTIVQEVRDWLETDTDYVRLTEVVDVEFPALPAEVLIPKQLAQLDAAEAELISKHLEALSSLQSRRKDLLSLAPPKAVSEVA